MTVSPEKIAELLERLRPRHTADEPLAQAVVSNSRDERRAAVSAYLVDNNALKSEAVAMLTTLRSQLSGITEETSSDDTDEMLKISALIARLQSTFDQFGDTCVYIRRGGLSWGAVALNRRSDDEKNGVFDLQATHDREMEERLGQVNRLIADRNEWRQRAWTAEAAIGGPGK